MRIKLIYSRVLVILVLVTRVKFSARVLNLVQQRTHGHAACGMRHRGAVISARPARGAWWTTIGLLKMYGDFNGMFMVKNGSETARHGGPCEVGGG